MPNQLSDAWRQALSADTRREDSAGAPVELAVPCLTILHHPDLRRVGQRATLPSLDSPGRTELSRTRPIFGRRDAGAAGPLADPFLSRRPWSLRSDGQVLHAERSGSPTSLKIDGVAVGGAATLSAERLAGGVVLELAGRVALALHLASPVPEGAGERHGLIGENAAMERLRRDLERVAALDVPVLVRGETGSGKELVARALHRASRRARGPFVAVNMAAVPVSLAAAELFGARRGAFTGADRQRLGYFRQARGGTLFLDEVGETPAEIQPLLLRALDTGEVQPVGGGAAEPTDVRVVAATDLDLEAAIAGDAFRAPLYHRLSGYELLVPPLRRRLEDLGCLLRHFLIEELEGLGCRHLLDLTDPGADPWLTAPTVARLALYPWPGNVRELRNAVREIAVDGHDRRRATLPPRLLRRLDDAPAGPRDPPAGAASDEEAPASGPWAGRPREIPEAVLLDTLRACRWQLKPVAETLGISRPSLYKLVAACPHIRRAADLPRDELEEALAATGGDLDAMVDRLEVSKEALRRRLVDLGLR